MRRFYASLRDALRVGPVALATVVRAEGSTPRREGAQLFVTSDGHLVGTVGGGATEARVIAAAGETLNTGRPAVLTADLRGRAGEIRDGICGGTMTVRIEALRDEHAAAEVETVWAGLEAGRAVRIWLADGLRLSPVAEAWSGWIAPEPRVVIVGAGHIGRALAALAGRLDFRVGVTDDRADWLVPEAFPADCELDPTAEAAVARLQCWEGGRYAALVTRGFREDLAALAALRDVADWTYVGLLGSRRRVAAVLAEVPDRPWGEGVLHAPVGLPIGAETPEEIAVSIAAEMVRVRRAGSQA